MENPKNGKEVFAGASFNDAPDPATLPKPRIPPEFTIKKSQPEKTKKQKKPARNK